MAHGRRPRIVFVTNRDSFFTEYRLPIARAERDRGAEVVVIAPDGDAADAIRSEGFCFIPLQMLRRGIGPTGEARSFRALLALYRELRPSLVHHWTIKPVLYGSLAARLVPNTAVVNAICGLGYVFTEGGRAAVLRPFVKAAYRVALRHGNTHTVFENPDDLDDFVRMGLIGSNEASVIPGLGVNCERFRMAPEPTGTPVVILPCRMLWDKGVGDFVEAAKILVERGIRARFALVGVPDPGNPQTVPESQLRAWAASGVVEWWGRSHDMPRTYAESHIVVLPTFYREGVPRVLLEAAASGRPAVTTDMPGCREVVQHGANGLRVPPRDVNALAGALEEMIGDAEMRRRFGAASRQIALATFSEDVIVRRMLEVHDGLIVRGRTSGAPFPAPEQYDPPRDGAGAVHSLQSEVA